MKSPKERRHKGSANSGRNYQKKNVYKSFRSLKESFVDVFDKLGGSEGLYKFVKKSQANRRMFYTMVSKMLPKEIALTTLDTPEALPFLINIEKAATPEKAKA